LLIIFLTIPCIAQKDGKTFKVVIDAGHGGKDPGCLGAYTKEKDVALNIALKTGKLISDNCPNVKVIYTRNTDVFVELYRRAKIANDNHADLFISFHCNASENKTAHGIDTWVMGLHKSEANLAVARAENSAMLKEKDYEQNYGGFNPNSPESAVMFSLYSAAYLNNSILLADKVQKNLIATTHLRDRGVNQAGYWVLWAVSMPSILIEMGFLTNPTEEKYLSEEKHKEEIANAIFRGFASYYTQMTGNKVNVPDVKVNTKETDKTDNGIAEHDNGNDHISDNQPDKKAEGEATSVKETEAKDDVVRFKVQFMALPNKVSQNDSRLKNIPDADCYYENNMWKYTAGNEKDLQSAKALLKEVKVKYPDAFIIAFKGNEKIPVSEAVKLISQ
jgi:N-acetylmuramoyl-L-alanine amidase